MDIHDWIIAIIVTLIILSIPMGIVWAEHDRQQKIKRQVIMTNDEIIKAYKKCQDANMGGNLRYWEYSNNPAELICIPRP